MAEDKKENQESEQGAIKVSVQLEGFAQASELEKAQKDIDSLKASLSEQELPKEKLEKKLKELQSKVVELESKLEGEKDSILKALTKELKLKNKSEVVDSFKEIKQIKETRKKEKTSTSSAKESTTANADLLGNLKSKVESGEGLISALSGSIKEKSASINETFSVKGAKSFGRTLGKSMFAGDDILSAYMRGRFAEPKKKTKRETVSPKLEAVKNVVSDGKIGESLSPVPTQEPQQTTPTPEKESVDEATLNIVAKNTMSLPDIARDMNVLRQNMQQLVEIWSSNEDKEKAKEDKTKVYATSADMMFHSESEMRKRTEVQKEEYKEKEAEQQKATSPTPERVDSEKETDQVDSEKESEEERAADVSYFEEQDKKEAELEAGRLKPEKVSASTEGGEKEDSKFDLSSLLNIGKIVKGLVGKVISGIVGGIKAAIKFLFKPGNILKVLMRVAFIATIVASLFSGIIDGFKKYKETGSFSEAIVAGLGGMFSFLTFGLVNEDTLKKLWDNVSGFFEPVMSTITGIFKGIKNFFKKMFGGTVDVEDTDPKAQAPRPTMPDTKGYVPSKESKETKTEPPKTETPPAAPAPSPTPTSPTPAAKTPATTPTATPAKTKGTSEVDTAKHYESYEMALQQLKDTYMDRRDERNKVLEKLMSDPRYPEGVVDDPSSPEYPKELKVIDEKYDKHIKMAKAEVEDYKNRPGVKEYIKQLEKKSGDKFFDEDDLEEKLGGKKLATKVAGSKFTTTETQTVSGGGSQLTQRVLSEDAKKAQEELKALDDRQAEERKKVVDKLKSEGKIKGRFAKSTDFESIDELKNLKAKQDAERQNIISRIDSGTSMKTTSTPGASVSGGGGGGSVSAAPAKESAPSALPAATPSSGSQISSSSSQIAEGQRMESAADMGSVVNAPVTNNTTGVSGQKAPSKSSTAYNEDLAMMLAGT